MNSVKIKFVGSGNVPDTVKGAGFSVKPYAVKGGQADVDERDLYTILNRKVGEWEVANVSRKSVATKGEPDNSGGGNDAE